MINVTPSDDSDSLTRAEAELRLSLQTYLDCIAGNVSVNTYQSHKSQLSTFYDWFTAKTQEVLCPFDCAVHFLQFVASKSDLSQTTIKGYVSTLSNFFAYHDRRDPKILMNELGLILQNTSHVKLQAVGECVVIDIESIGGQALKTRIPHFISGLRRRDFGTRLHVYVELLLDTMGRPEQVRKVDIADLVLSDGKVAVGIPETHVVSLSGLVTERVASLSDTTVDAIETYLEYERCGPPSDQREALLTTHKGRASPSTLRRSVRQTSRMTSSDSIDQPQPIVPKDIWQYAMSPSQSQSW